MQVDPWQAGHGGQLLLNSCPNEPANADERPLRNQGRAVAAQLTAWCIIRIDPTCSEWPRCDGGGGDEGAGAGAGADMAWQCAHPDLKVGSEQTSSKASRDVK